MRPARALIIYRCTLTVDLIVQSEIRSCPAVSRFLSRWSGLPASIDQSQGSRDARNGCSS
eukprot:8199300-Pyramimonas_sp.AAC.1